MQEPLRIADSDVRTRPAVQLAAGVARISVESGDAAQIITPSLSNDCHITARKTTTPVPIGTRVPSSPMHSRGTTLLSGIPLTLQGHVFIPSSLITGDVPGQVYCGCQLASVSVGGSGRIFSGALASGSHLIRTLWTTAGRLLVSIVAFAVSS